MLSSTVKLYEPAIENIKEEKVKVRIEFNTNIKREKSLIFDL